MSAPAAPAAPAPAGEAEAPTAACSCCCEAFNKTTRRQVTCGYCQGDACLECVKTFVMMKEDPCCVLCQHAWTRDFVDGILPKSFRDTQLKTKREDVLFEREQALLPATQTSARAEVVRRRVVQNCDRLRCKRRQLMETLARLNAEISNGEECAWRLRNVVTGVNTVSMDVLDEFERPDGTFGSYYTLALNLSSSSSRDPSARRQFIKRCPREECNGFLSTQYKCGMCGVRVCPECLEVKPAAAPVAGAAAATGVAAHVCNPDNVASAKLIASECKVCPNAKCSSLVYKVDGCDQMWCTQCQTAFSWRTGKVETGRVHNPHFYEWQRRMNNGVIPREPGDEPGGCGGLRHDLNIPSLFTISMAKRSITWVGQVHRLLQHILLHTMPRFQGNYDHTNNLDLRISFLLKEIDAGKIKKALQQREKRRVKEAAIRDVLEFFVASGSDLLRQLARQETTEPSEILAMFVELRHLTNQALEDVTKRFSCKLYVLDATWKVNDNVMA